MVMEQKIQKNIFSLTFETIKACEIGVEWNAFVHTGDIGLLSFVLKKYTPKTYPKSVSQKCTSKVHPKSVPIWRGQRQYKKRYKKLLQKNKLTIQQQQKFRLPDSCLARKVAAEKKFKQK